MELLQLLELLEEMKVHRNPTVRVDDLSNDNTYDISGVGFEDDVVWIELN